MFGVASQATNSSFWNDTNGATEGVLYQAVSGPGVAVTPKTLPFVAAFNKRYGNNPSYCGYTAYDEVYYIADAIKRGRLDRSRQAGRRAGKDRIRRHDRPRRVQGQGLRPIRMRSRSAGTQSPGLMLQWQDGKQVNLWPANVANGKLKFPKFIKVGSAD